MNWSNAWPGLTETQVQVVGQASENEYNVVVQHNISFFTFVKLHFHNPHMEDRDDIMYIHKK